MSYSHSFVTGTAAGATIGFIIGYSQGSRKTSKCQRTFYGAIGAIAGAVFGEALGLGLKKGPTTTGSIIGGGLGALSGTPICTFLTAMASGGPDVTTVQMCSVFGVCTSITMISGAILGAISTKVQIQGLKFLLR